MKFRELVFDSCISDSTSVLRTIFKFSFSLDAGKK